MVDQYQQTVLLNNQGVARLGTGNLGKSFCFFRDALRNTMTILKKTVEPVAANTAGISPIVDNEEELSIMKAKKMCQGKGMEAFICRKALKSRLLSGTANPHFIFDEGICLMEGEDIYSPNRVVNASVASSIVLFNLALIHHIKGLKEISSKYLSKALSLYQKSFALLTETGLTLGRTGHPVIDFVAMALLNNAGQVGRELCITELSNDNFNKLITVAMQVNSSNYGGCSCSVTLFMDEMKMNFLLNAICFNQQTLAAAA